MDSQAKAYIARINRVIDYIHNNMDRSMTVQELAEVATFSQFHFHRIFSALVGETVLSYIQRKRMESAASVLISNPSLSITEVALDHGFSGSASFARLFKQSYNMSATAWRKGGYNDFCKISSRHSKNGKTKSRNGKETENSKPYISWYRESDVNYSTDIRTNKNGEKSMSTIENVTVEVRNIPEMTIAYIRHIGPYKGNLELFGSLWGRMMAWAGSHDLLTQKDMKSLCIYHDNPDITDDENLILDVCISVPANTEVGGEVGKRTIAAGKYAVAHFEISPEEYEQAWNYIYGSWFPGSGYEPDDGECYEQFLNDPKSHPEGKHVINICVPVKAM